MNAMCTAEFQIQLKILKENQEIGKVVFTAFEFFKENRKRRKKNRGEENLS